MENNGIGVGDAMLLAQNGNGNCAWFMWIFILFALMGGNGWGNNRNAATTNDVYAANDSQNTWNSLRDISRQINSVGDGIASATFSLNNTVTNGFTGVMRDQFSMQNAMMGGFNNVAQAVAENRYAQQQCCCETNRNLDNLRYTSAMETAGITENATANTQRILDKLCSMEANAKDAEIANLRQQLANANLAYSQQAQNAAIIGAVRPFPNPAYLVSNPYGTNVCNCGING